MLVKRGGGLVPVSKNKSAYRARYSTSEVIIAVILVFFYPALQKTGCSASIIPDPWEDLYPSIYLKWTDSKALCQIEVCTHRYGFPLATESVRWSLVEDVLDFTGSVTANRM